MGEVGNIPLKLIANETALPTELYPRASERNYRETPLRPASEKLCGGLGPEGLLPSGRVREDLTEGKRPPAAR